MESILRLAKPFMGTESIEDRLLRESEELITDPPALCTAAPLDGDMRHWTGVIKGPPRSPYANGIFELDIKFDHLYPRSPPRVTFKTKLYHMNIAEDGRICLDILKRKWKPEISVAQILLALCNLLSSPNPKSALQPEKAQVWNANRGQYNQLAQEWTMMYAKKVA